MKRPKTPVELFLDKIKTDDALKQKVSKFEETAREGALQVEREAENQAKANALTIMSLAKEAGFDIPLDFFRQSKAFLVASDKEAEGSDCTLTCCWVATSCLHTCWWTES